jgi:formylmethanofuran dehydrogenase subunit A
MRINIKGGHIIDPANKRDEIGDIWIAGHQIVAPPEGGAKADETVDAQGLLVMAGGIDIHSHIAGGNVNTARLLLPEFHRAHAPRPAGTALSYAGWSTFETGRLYAEMGFTTVVEPAVSPHRALHAHLELADIPIIDKAILTILGNDDFVLGLMRSGEGANAIRDHVAWTLQTTRALGIKVINAGGVAAFKDNVRSFSFDDVVPYYGVTSRQIVKTLQKAVHELGVPHPLHVHCNNLGLPGNFETALTTIAAAEDLPLHLAHLQFYGYGGEGAQKFSSAAPKLAEAVNAAKNVTIDVGQAMFGQTVTISSDVLRQFAARFQARPKKYVIFDGDSNGGGIVPYEYRAGSFHNAIQFAVGLELFLLIEDPWRVFFTTDHPNGAPFTAYPDLFALLMSRDLRSQWLSRVPTEAAAMTTLPSLTREYNLYEIATMTRAAPAKLLGLPDRGHLGAGARADVALYRPNDDIAKMFSSAAYVFKDGDLVVRDGEVTHYRFGRALQVTPSVEAAMERRMRQYYDARYGLPSDFMRVPEGAIGRPQPFEAVACQQ